MSATARRVEIHEARRHFEAGGEVMVSEYGDRETIPVAPSTVTHTAKTTTWENLVEQVRMWRNRYPRQRFYIVDREEQDT